MKTLQLNEMESIEGGMGQCQKVFIIGFTSMLAMTIFTGGPGIIPGAIGFVGGIAAAC